MLHDLLEIQAITNHYIKTTAIVGIGLNFLKRALLS